jgi:hypothetical protein
LIDIHKIIDFTYGLAAAILQAQFAWRTTQ